MLLGILLTHVPQNVGNRRKTPEKPKPKCLSWVEHYNILMSTIHNEMNALATGINMENLETN